MDSDREVVGMGASVADLWTHSTLNISSVVHLLSVDELFAFRHVLLDQEQASCVMAG